MNDGSLFPLRKQPADIQTGIQMAETDKTDNNKREKERLNISADFHGSWTSDAGMSLDSPPSKRNHL